MALVLATSAALAAQAPARRAIAYTDLAPQVRDWLRRAHPDAGRDASAFEAYVRRLEARSRERSLQGEGEHLVYYVLQSTGFTDEAPIEPALSAKAFVANLTAEERRRLLEDPAYVPGPERVPANVVRRMRAFLGARSREMRDARFAQVQQLLGDHANRSAFDRFRVEYARAMRFLYLKEFPQNADGPAVATLYQHRGYSTDTAFEANYAVHHALGVLKNLAPGESLNRILIVGPGLDLAPRTSLVDLFPPQSYQPFAIADSILSLGLGDRAQLSIHAVDVNDAVIRYLDGVRQGRVTDVSVVSGIRETPEQPLVDEYRRYFRDFGSRIGQRKLHAPATAPVDRLFTSIRIDNTLASRFSAERLDILTERYTAAPAYDLAVVTNVLTYFDDAELALALANLASMLRGGGYLVHNESRQMLAGLAAAQGLAPIHSRSVLIAKGLYDVVWIHRKDSPSKGGLMCGPKLPDGRSLGEGG